MRFVIIGGGPGGNTAATYAARHGAEVVMIEKDVVGGAAHLWDCIPSKAMIATGGAMSFLARAEGMGLGDVSPRIDVDNLATRLATIEQRLNRSTTSLLESQNVRLIEGTGSLKGPHQVVAETADGLEEIEADVVVLSTGSRPRIPDWAPVDGDAGADVAEAHALGPGQERHGAAGGDHGLGRDAVPQVGGAADDVLFDHDDLGAVAGGVGGRRVAAGAAADDDEARGCHGWSGYRVDPSGPVECGSCRPLPDRSASAVGRSGAPGCCCGPVT